MTALSTGSLAAVPTLDLVVILIAARIVLGALGLVRPRDPRFVSRFIFPAGAWSRCCSLVALLSLGAPPQARVMPLALPKLPFHVRLDVDIAGCPPAPTALLR